MTGPVEARVVCECRRRVWPGNPASVRMAAAAAARENLRATLFHVRECGPVADRLDEIRADVVEGWAEFAMVALGEP